MLAGNFQNWIQVRRLTEKMNWNDGSGARGDGLRDARWIHGVSAFVNVDKNRTSSTKGDRLRRCHKRVRDSDDLVVSADSKSEER